ncbi:MAG: apolipoprotein N-acyltransferase [Bacteroidetes bacterium RBG_13_42_15]|nr:MAG: apolipoprotein N-acyltransferase [Bacteroidetes bacterium RBG_13_42_15]
MAFMALVPFFFFIRKKTLKEVLLGSYIAALIWSTGTVYWIGWATVAGAIGTLIVYPIYFVLFALLLHWTLKFWGEKAFWMTPVIWTAIEMITASGQLAFPWNIIGYSQSYYRYPIQFASLTGVYGISIWIILINVLFYQVLKHRKGKFSRYIFSLIVLYLVPWIHGLFALPENRPEINRTVALIQGNIDPRKKWTPAFIDSNFVIYHDLTEQSHRFSPDLIIWPETATPCYLRYRYSYLQKVKDQIDSLNVPLLTGTPDYVWIDENHFAVYNAALLLRPKSWEVELYYKQNLVPFSERVPFVDQIPFLYNLAARMDLDIGSYAPGHSTGIFSINPGTTNAFRFSTIICFESVFPYLVRKFMANGAQFLVIITNDGWFGNTAGPYQHAQMAIFRAIENRTWIARCANTGISMFIDPSGKVVSRTRLNQKSTLVHQIGLQDNRSFFNRHGEWIIYIVYGEFLIILIMTAVKSVLSKYLKIRHS